MLLTATPFATPWTFTLLTTQLSHLNMWLGAPALSAFAPIHTLLGTLVLLWLFLLPELLWGLAQWLPVTQASGSSTSRAAFTSAAPMRSSRGG
ncbi:hypothetical protein [Massilia sp. DD77]|uniref:hypothetical protein n=1 Tax=Massilia sp. DD77 TaxID=3109349 RepID=UPI002FFF7D32